MIEDDGQSIACPLCGSVRVRPSKRFRAEDLLLALRLKRPYRCRECRMRFPVRTGLFTRSGTLRSAINRRLRRMWKDRPGHQPKRTMLILLGAAALVVLFLRWLASMPFSSD